jgi:hypothetical protein
MHLRKLSLALVISLVSGGCLGGDQGSYGTYQGAPPPAGSGPSVGKGGISFTGTLRAPGTSKVPGAPAGEWLIEMPKDAHGKVTTTAIDISNVADRARALEGKQVKATMPIPKAGDPGLEASTVKLLSLEPR